MVLCLILFQDLINGAAVPEKPVVLLLACTDGQVECQELASFANVKSYANLTDSTLIPDETCALTVGIMTGPAVQIDALLLNRCPRLRIVIRHGIGYENIDVEYAGAMGIIVCNVPDYGIEEVADTAMSHILALFRQTTFMHHALSEGKKVLSYDDYCTSMRNARRVRGKTLGLIGLGKTGIAVALRARAFGFNVIFYDPYTSHGLDKAIGGLERYYTVGDLISRCDCVSLHCMLTKETRHMINATTFKLFKKGAFLVNVSRGSLVDEEALAKALKDGRLGGAALDVHESEPFTYGEGPLPNLPNLICTPHIAWYSKESFAELRISAIHTMKLALSSMQGVNIQNCVNSDFLNKEACQARWNPQPAQPQCPPIPEPTEATPMMDEECPTSNTEETEVPSVVPTELPATVVSTELPASVVPTELPTEIPAELSSEIQSED